MARRLADRLVFCTTTTVLADQYESMLDTKPHIMPWIKRSPVPRPHVGPNGTHPSTQRGRQITAAYIGYGRPEKGYRLLPSIVERCTGIPGLRFSIEACWHDPKLAAVDAVLEKNGKVQLVKGALDTDRYLAFIADADVILVLNDPDCGFRQMVSGVYADAVLAGKPVMPTGKTWAGSQVSVNGNGVLFEPYTAEAMSAALAKAVTDIERLSSRATRACGRITAATRAQGRRRFLPAVSNRRGPGRT